MDTYFLLTVLIAGRDVPVSLGPYLSFEYAAEIADNHLIPMIEYACGSPIPAFTYQIDECFARDGEWIAISHLKKVKEF